MICVEGIDRSGKTSAIQSLSNILDVEIVSFPERSNFTGRLLNKFLKGKDLNKQATHLLFSANRWEVMSSLKRDKVVVIDRYYYSGIAYSMVI